MELYLIRHGIAVERGIYAEDEARPLTEKGIKKTTKVAQKLASLDIQFDYLLTSPLVRAQETAKSLENLGLAKETEVKDYLAPGGNINLWLDWLATNYSESAKVALVGHQPNLGNWAEMLVFGKISQQLILKKAGVIGIKLSEPNELLENNQLFLLASPKWLI